MLVTDTTELRKLDRRSLNKYLKRLLHLKRMLPEKLLDRLFLRTQIPSLQMDIEKNIRNWKAKLQRSVYSDPASKARDHSRDKLGSIDKLTMDTMVRRFKTHPAIDKSRWLIKFFKAWNRDLTGATSKSRTVDKVLKADIDNDTLDCPCSLYCREGFSLPVCCISIPPIYQTNRRGDVNPKPDHERNNIVV